VKNIFLLIITFFYLSIALAEPNYDAAISKFDQKNYRGALSDLDKSIELEPENAVAFAMRGVSKSKLGDWDGAIADAEQAVSLAKKSSLAELPQYQDILQKLTDGKARASSENAQSASYGIVVDPDEIVAAHNRWRAAVGVGGITYSSKLAASSQAWVNHLKDEENCQLHHSSGTIGENLYGHSAWSSGEIYQTKNSEVIDAWGNEKSDFNYADNSCATGKVCGHYTQLVWKNSTSVGCAMTVCPNGFQIWACQYEPAGNWFGEKPY
jgi:tetratricopeptide (TPR) repeat protein